MEFSLEKKREEMGGKEKREREGKEMLKREENKVTFYCH